MRCSTDMSLQGEWRAVSITAKWQAHTPLEQIHMNTCGAPHPEVSPFAPHNGNCCATWSTHASLECTRIYKTHASPTPTPQMCRWKFTYPHSLYSQLYTVKPSWMFSQFSYPHTLHSELYTVKPLWMFSYPHTIYIYVDVYLYKIPGYHIREIMFTYT